MRAQDFAALPDGVRRTIIDEWMILECETRGGVDPFKLLSHSETCAECRAELIRRFMIFLEANVDALNVRRAEALILLSY